MKSLVQVPQPATDKEKTQTQSTWPQSWVWQPRPWYAFSLHFATRIQAPGFTRLVTQFCSFYNGASEAWANTVSEFTTSLWNPWAMVLRWEKVSSQDFGTTLSSVPTTRERGTSDICRTGYRQWRGWFADRFKALLDGVLHVPGPGLGAWPATFSLLCALMVGPQSDWGRPTSQASSPTPALSWWHSSRPLRCS